MDFARIDTSDNTRIKRVKQNARKELYTNIIGGLLIGFVWLAMHLVTML